MFYIKNLLLAQYPSSKKVFNFSLQCRSVMMILEPPLWRTFLHTTSVLVSFLSDVGTDSPCARCTDVRSSVLGP